MAVGHGVAQAVPSSVAAPDRVQAREPIGPPLVISIPHGVQQGVADGATSLANAAACREGTTGRQCLIRGAVASVATGAARGAAVCPNRGTREISVQGFTTPPTRALPEGVIWRVTGNRCV